MEIENTGILFMLLKINIMIILRQKRFSEKDKPNVTNHIAKGAILSYIGGKVGETAGKTISRGNQIKEVVERIKTELPEKAKLGDQKAAEMLSKINNNPEGFFGKVYNITKDSPRTKKAGKIGKRVGIIVPASLVTVSYLKKKKGESKNDNSTH